jgi:heme-degrading monooxygenase HmoA
MAVKVMIRRIVPQDKMREMVSLLREMRSLATNQAGYISGETLKGLDVVDEYLVISTWESEKYWDQWLRSHQRQDVQARIDALLGGKTHYNIYHYGLKTGD